MCIGGNGEGIVRGGGVGGILQGIGKGGRELWTEIFPSYSFQPPNNIMPLFFTK